MMDSRVLVPYYELWIGGNKLSNYETKLIQSVVFSDTDSGSNLLTVNFEDPDFILIDDPRITKATPVQFIGGFYFNSRKMFEGYISMVDFTFPENGVPTLTITCMDKSFIMDRVERRETYKNMRYDQIATKIAQRNGFSIVTKNTGKIHEQVTQSDKTDIQFLVDLGNEIDYFVNVEGSTLYFLPRDYQSTPQKTYWYRRPPFNLISFTPRLVQADVKVGIDEHDIDEKTGKTVTGVADDSTPGPTLGKQTNSAKDNSGVSMILDKNTGKWIRMDR